MLSNNQYSIPKREALAGEIGDRGVERCVPDRDAR